MLDNILYPLGITVIASPFALLAILGLASLLNIKFSETLITRLTYASVITGLIAALSIFAVMVASGLRFIPIDIGDWVSIPDEQHFHFRLKLIFDRLSIPFTMLSFVLCGTVAAFTSRYLHREPGFRRFYLLYAIFLSGMILSSLAGTIETLFFGWELVGLSSALLVAFFHERESPVLNGLRVWSIYRLADAAFMVAALLMHHLTGAGDFEAFAGVGPWPEGQAVISSYHATVIGALLLLAAAGKSALVPLSGWLPRAMEGPTPSSAVFYGALSVHLGAYLLLRVSPILQASFILQSMVILIGILSAVFGSMMSHVQSDIKTSLAYSSLTQVGIIIVEIGLGFQYLALVHIIGHACMRSLQLLRAPTLLHDYHQMENAIGYHLHNESSRIDWFLPQWVVHWAYRFGFERGYMDLLLDNWIVTPFMAAFRWADRAERSWTDWLSKEPSRESDAAELHPELNERVL